MCCIKGNPELRRKYQEMEKARKELEESAFLAATNSQPSTSVIPGTCGATETFTPKRSSLSTSRASCEKSPSKSVTVCSDRKLQQTCSSGFSKEEVLSSTHRNDQNNSICSDVPPKAKKVRRTKDQASSMSDLTIPRSREVNTKEDKDGFFFLHKPCITCSDELEKGDVPLMEEKNTSAMCLNKLCLDTGKQRRMVSTTCTSIEPPLNKKSPCKECDQQLPDEEIYREDLSDSRKKRLKEFYKCSQVDIDYVYISQLKRQFDEAKRKLEDAVMLASISLKQLAGRNYECPSKRATSSICDSVPERDICSPKDDKSSAGTRNELEMPRFDYMGNEESTKFTPLGPKIPVNTNSFRSSYSKAPLFDSDSSSPFLKIHRRSPRPFQQSVDSAMQTENSISHISVSIISLCSNENENSSKSLELLEHKKTSAPVMLQSVPQTGSTTGKIGDSSPKIMESNKSIQKKPSGSKVRCLSKTCSSKVSSDCCCGKVKKVQDFVHSSKIFK
ncbi:uncharacterized protein LOC126746485 isoform X2 [Anthonomus grandis grandis]|nr:uncharacterized protein LOC126746485 isoform X2 [Anthonomus grandis grandis]